MINAKITINPKASIVVKRIEKEKVVNKRRKKHRRVYTVGNTTLIMHSDLLLLTRKQRREWIRVEAENKNPILMQIGQAINNCYQTDKGF